MHADAGGLADGGRRRKWAGTMDGGLAAGKDAGDVGAVGGLPFRG